MLLPVLQREDIGRVRLWRAVLAQALRDLLADPRGEATHADRTELLWNRREARKWLSRPSVAFDDACTLAGLSPDNFRRAARLLILALRKGDRRETSRIRRSLFAALNMDPVQIEEPLIFEMND